MARREKNQPGFSHVRACGLGWTNFPPVIYAYIQSRRLRTCVAAWIGYRHILLGENSFNLIRTREHEKNPARFFRAEQVYVLYIAGKNVKNCKVRSCLCPLDPSIFHFIWVKYGGKIWQLEPSNQICKKMEIAWKVRNCADCTNIVKRL